MTLTTIPSQPVDAAAGGQLVAADGRTLPLRAMTLTATAGGGLCRSVLTQTFVNPGSEPLTVTYLLPLPVEAAVSAFAFQLGARRIVGEIDRREAARERFEAALAQGRAAALLDQERANLFTQTIGNIPPGAEIVAEVTVDQKLTWRDSGWEWRFPTCVAPRYLGAQGRVADAEQVRVDVASHPLPPRLTLALTITDALAGGAPQSASHAILARADERGVAVTLAAEAGTRLDRDLALHWPVAAPAVGATLRVGRSVIGGPRSEHAHGLLTLVPPGTVTPGTTVARDLIVLLDISGSMAGAPLDQARHVVGTLVDSLGPADHLELLAFSTEVQRWARAPVAMDAAARVRAQRWLAQLQAGGGTEMRQAITAALQPLHAESQRQVVLVTDGLIGFEQEIVADILGQLPAGSRVHTVGVGAAVNRALTAGAARAGRGTEVVIGLEQAPALAARQLLEHTAAPLVVDLTVDGAALRGCAPQRLPDLFGAAPALLALALDPRGGPLTVRGRTRDGSFSHTLTVPPVAADGQGRELVALFGREALADLEMERSASRATDRVDARIEQLALECQLASRRTSWVAVAEEPSVDPQAPMRRVRVPHELPHGMSIQGLGLRSQEEMVCLSAPAPCAPPPPRKSLMSADDEAPRSGAAKPRGFAPRRGGEGAATPPPGAVVAGVVRAWRNGELLVECTPGTAWPTLVRVRVGWADGTVMECLVDANRTTRPGPLAPGQSVRLVLRVAGTAPVAAPAWIEAGALRIVLAAS